MTPEAAAEHGFYARARGDAELSDLLGPGTRIMPGFPHDLPKASDVPRLTFYVFGPSRLVRGVQRVRVSCDLWVWPTGTRGGRDRLLAIDGRLCDLFDAEFHHASHWLVSAPGGFRDFPAGPDEPLRRHREVIIDAAALSGA